MPYPPPQTAKIQVIWLNWSFTEKDLAFMNQGARWLFDWRTNSDAAEYGMSTDDAIHRGGYLGYGRRPRSTTLGANLGEVHLGDGTKVDLGRVLIKGMWTAALHNPLAFAFSNGQAASRPDVLIHKNKNWGMSDSMTTCTDYPKMVEVFGNSNSPG